MTDFMFLFRSNLDAYRSMSPEQMQATMKRWIEWKDNLEKNGHWKQYGQRLDSAGKVVKGATKTVMDGPYVEVKDFVQGYMIAIAENLDHAATLARDCPVLDTGGSVEVRPIIIQ